MTLFTGINILNIAILLIVSYTSYYYYKYFTRENPLPGPLPLPLIGNLFTILRDVSIWPSELQSKYGDIFEVYAGPSRKVWLCNEELAEKFLIPVIRSNFHNRINKNSDLREIGIVNTGLAYNIDYESWAFIRKFYSKSIFSPPFLKQALISTQNSFQKMENYWRTLGEDAVQDFTQWAQNYVIDTVDIVTTSKSSNALACYYKKISSDNTEVSDRILKESEHLSKCTRGYATSILWYRSVPKIFRNFPGIHLFTKKLKEQVNWLRTNAINIVKNRREEIERTPEDISLTRDLLTMFLTINTTRDITKGIADDINDRPLSDEEIAPVFMEISLASFFSTSEVMGHIFHMISKHPKVKKQLVKEFNDVFGEDPDSQITYEGINKLDYCDAVLKEALRTSPFLPFLAKTNEKPDQINGYEFPENTDFYLNIQAFHKNKSKWKDPELFNPDRFMDKSHPDYKNQLYIFGSGVREEIWLNLY
ncbi:14028_t:CDS:2 [Acaulospora morrowiae]|uniref:14028_t:CDS:1 n=1 Tax=Acaulospora morrowiae TaxID=94023 RepID=A0A9N9AMF5_9GLOM|nr:14028_t:CDS:2 [Acaulospora morrowiae]